MVVLPVLSDLPQAEHRRLGYPARRAWHENQKKTEEIKRKQYVSEVHIAGMIACSEIARVVSEQFFCASVRFAQPGRNWASERRLGLLEIEAALCLLELS